MHENHSIVKQNLTVLLKMYYFITPSHCYLFSMGKCIYSITEMKLQQRFILFSGWTCISAGWFSLVLIDPQFFHFGNSRKSFPTALAILWLLTSVVSCVFWPQTTQTQSSPTSFANTKLHAWTLPHMPCRLRQKNAWIQITYRCIQIQQ